MQPHGNCRRGTQWQSHRHGGQIEMSAFVYIEKFNMKKTALLNCCRLYSLKSNIFWGLMINWCSYELCNYVVEDPSARNLDPKRFISPHLHRNWADRFGSAVKKLIVLSVWGTNLKGWMFKASKPGVKQWGVNLLDHNGLHLVIQIYNRKWFDSYLNRSPYSLDPGTGLLEAQCEQQSLNWNYNFFINRIVWPSMLPPAYLGG